VHGFLLSRRALTGIFPMDRRDGFVGSHSTILPVASQSKIPGRDQCLIIQEWAASDNP
jgi:hypothetical protein